eukprot:Pgem_evm2s863
MMFALSILFLPLVQAGCSSFSSFEKLQTDVKTLYKCDANEKYNNSRKSENALPRRKKDPFPEVITFPKTEAEVIQIVKYASSYNLIVCARGGGHSYEGYGSCDGGVLVDMKNFDNMEFPNPNDKSIVELGAGVILGNMYTFLAPHGRVLPAGTWPTVGVAGHTLGGGYGFLARKYGFNSDRLAGARVVLSNGTAIDCNKDLNSELFWGLRGGGGGNFGIVTSFTFNTAPLPTQAVNVHARWNCYFYGKRVMKAFVESFKAHQQSEDFTVRIQIMNNDIEIKGVVINHSEDQVRKIMEEAFSDIPETKFNIDHTQYLDAALDKPVIDHYEREDPQDNLFKRLSSAVFEHVTDDLLESIYRAWIETDKDKHPEKQYRFLQLDPFGGAINHLQQNETALPYRSNSDYMIQVFSVFFDEKNIDREVEFVERIKKVAIPFSIGNYINYIDAQDSVKSYYGDNLDALKGLKVKYDSMNMFNFPQAIPVDN